VSHAEGGKLRYLWDVVCIAEHRVDRRRSWGGLAKRSSNMSRVRISEIQNGKRRTFFGVIFRLLVGRPQLLKRAEQDKLRSSSSGANWESRLRFIAERNEVCVELSDIYIYRGTRSSRPLGRITSRSRNVMPSSELGWRDEGG
jgi:hypothetical protein